jgi:hypothetical protein
MANPQNAVDKPELPSSEDLIVICAWCTPLNIIRLEQRPGDVFCWSRNHDGDLQVTRMRTGDRPLARHLMVSHGICDSCRSKHYGEVSR